MKNLLRLLFFIFIMSTVGYTQIVQTGTQLKNFQQTLSSTNLQFVFPKDFKEIKAAYDAELNVDYAMELPNAKFQLWLMVKNIQQEQAKIKASEDNPKRALNNADSLYSSASLLAANKLAGKGNYTYKNLPQDVLDWFRADEGRSYQLNLYDRQETSHYKNGLLLSLQKNGRGCILMLFLGNEDGPDFYKKVNKAYYSVRFNWCFFYRQKITNIYYKLSFLNGLCKR